MADALWQAVLGEIEVTIPRASFATWFQNTNLIKREAGEIVIGVPSVFAKRQLEDKYRPLLESTLKKNGVTPDQLSFVIQAPPPETELDSIKQPSTDWSVRPRKKVPENNLNSKYTFDNFVVGASNELAYAAAQAIARDPGNKYNPFFIYGGVGLGKTHLIQAIGNHICADNPDAVIAYITSEQFATEFIASILRKKTFSDHYRQADVLIVDDMQFIAGKEKTEEEFFHTFNALHQANKQIIISSDKPPKAIPTLEERLRR
ncbi:MAG: DnaA/Hda family protein, partial [Candidatus Saccharimonadales bacterium]